MNLSLEVVFDFCGFPDYYRGHGHAFLDDRVVACVMFGPSVSYRETVGEIIDMILEDINSRAEPIEFLNSAEADAELQEKIREFLSDENIREAIKAELGIKDEKELDEPFFDVDEDDLPDDDDPDGMMEWPMLIGYIHVWKDE
jgi:hypothetical protein